MAWWLCSLTIAAFALSAVVTTLSERTSDNAGVCIRLIQYVASDGRRATNGTTLTYCAGETDCHRTPVRVCCNGWRRDPNSKKLRCIKINPNDSASTGTSYIDSDLSSAEDSPSMQWASNVLKKEVGAQNNVRRARDSPSASGSTPAGGSPVNMDQSRVDVSPSGGSDNPNGSQQTSHSSVSAQTPSQQGPLSGAHTENGTGIHQEITNITNTPISNSTATVTDRSSKVSERPDNQPVVSPDLTAAANGKTETGAVQSSQPDTPVMTGPSSNDSTHSLTNEKQPLERPSSSSNNSGTQSDPNVVANAPTSAINDKDATHDNVTQDLPAPRSKTSGNGASQEPSKSGLAPASAEAPPHVSGQPVVTGLEQKNNASNQSLIGHTEGKPQTPAKVDHSNQQGETVPSRSPEGPGVAPASTTTVSTSVVPHAPVPITNQPAAVGASKAQPQGSPSATSTPSPPSGHRLDTVTTASPVVTTPSQSKELTTPPHQNIKNDSHISVVSTTAHPQQNTSSTQDTANLTLTSHELEFGRREETIPVSCPPSPTVPTTGTTITAATTTKVPIIAATTTNATPIAVAPHPEVVNTTHPAQNATSNSSAHTGHSSPLGIATTTNPLSVAKSTTVPAPQHPSVPTGNHTHEYNVSVDTSLQRNASAGNTTGNNGNGTSVANCTAAGHAQNCSGVNCSHVEHQNNCTDSNTTIPAPASTTLPVAKPLGDKPHTSNTAETSGSSASKTASEVTISLLVVAAIAFVVALLYWRARRRRRRYINCGTREPNLNFSNPVYDLEAMMEQTSLVKLQNAAEIEDGDGDSSEPEPTFQRK